MLKINDKTFMNLQEAVQWLLENNALPFQSSANYVANAEIGMGTIVNPSPAKVRIGSLIFFADSKVSTVTGLTENGFIVSDQYNDLVDDVVYVSNVALNASGHLIVTLSNGDTIDAGLIKQVNNFSINGSQHLIASYNDGTSTDLGAIFSGNISISGNLTVTGGISGNAITGNSIIEIMSGYSFVQPSATGYTFEVVYAGVVKNGNKLTLVEAVKITKGALANDNNPAIGRFVVPADIANALYPTNIGGDNVLDVRQLNAYLNKDNSVDARAYMTKSYTTESMIVNTYNMVQDSTYFVRYEVTFLLSDNLAQ